MLLDRKEITFSGSTDTIIEGYYDSSNILKTSYIPNKEFMFIFFQNKLVYSYSNITMDLYEKFEKADSQGKFFITEIKKKPREYNYLREYKLYEFEKQDIISIIESLKSGETDQNQNIL
jgi:KTSC domain